VTAVILTIQAQAASNENEKIYTPETKEMWDAATKFIDTFGDVSKDLTNALLDPEFQDAYVDKVAELIDIAGHWVGQIPPTPYELKQDINDLFNAAQNWVQRLDPLTLDLDGDGLETTGFTAANPIYFDHDLNGIKEGTGWVKADDGFLVLDRNGNGTIDNGLELFGDHTLLATGGFANDGFAALAQEDTNHDGKVDATDVRFAELRVWRDLNQNGLSEANELFTLNSLGIAAINVVSIHNTAYVGLRNPTTNYFLELIPLMQSATNVLSDFQRGCLRIICRVSLSAA
jgi:hypothetical protein